MKMKYSLLAMIVGAAMAHSSAMAGQVKINFSDAGFFNGTLTPTTPASTVWATAVFSDTITPGKVTLTMTVSMALASSTSYVSQWYFNTKVPMLSVLNIDPPGATISYGPGGPPGPSCCSPNGLTGDFDLQFSFLTSAGFLNQGGQSIFEITGSGLTASSFNDYTPTGGNGNNGNGGFLAAVKVQGAGQSYEVRGVEGDGVIDEQGSVPEPGTMALIGLGLLGAVATRRRRS
jgi:hypothetical protein